jgi:hypothetical protein
MAPNLLKNLLQPFERVLHIGLLHQRDEKFEKTTLDENVILDRTLNLDYKTRWNSTFIMLSIAIPIGRFLNVLVTLIETIFAEQSMIGFLPLQFVRNWKYYMS